jgi:hypothetical protein
LDDTVEISNIPEIAPMKKSGVPRSSKIAAQPKAAPVLAPDKVELATTHDRDIVLNAIKAKVKQGFYKSDEVTEDITDKLANLFERS